MPSHDTIQRVMGMIRPENLQQLQLKWQEMLDRSEGEKLKKIICVDGKSNGITAIPKVLENIEIKGQVVTIDAMGTQTEIVETIRKRRADYVLAVKGNQGNLETDI
ncbi:MAG: ISAs1 family transposase [Lachnospiraceae bacterium]|nr:ISAs1 family transposase [Lachnospiraceae bacterium]